MNLRQFSFCRGYNYELVYQLIKSIKCDEILTTWNALMAVGYFEYKNYLSNFLKWNFHRTKKVIWLLFTIFLSLLNIRIEYRNFSMLVIWSSFLILFTELHGSSKLILPPFWKKADWLFSALSKLKIV